MVLSEWVSPGDKIDLNLTQHLERQLNVGEEVEIPTFKSSVLDVMEPNHVEISMPTLGNKMILFQVGYRCQLLFISHKGMCVCDSVVKNRYKKGNIYMLLMEVVTVPKKFQRREFFRIDYSMDLRFYKAPEDVAGLRSTETIFLELQKPDYIGKAISATSIDLSGGGIKFSSSEKVEEESYIIVNMRLSNERLDQTFYLIGKVISCIPMDKVKDRYVTRVKFLFTDPKDRETIVRFVFEEERKARNKDNG